MLCHDCVGTVSEYFHWPSNDLTSICESLKRYHRGIHIWHRYVQCHFTIMWILLYIYYLANCCPRVAWNSGFFRLLRSRCSMTSIAPFPSGWSSTYKRDNEQNKIEQSFRSGVSLEGLDQGFGFVISVGWDSPLEIYEKRRFLTRPRNTPSRKNIWFLSPLLVPGRRGGIICIWFPYDFLIIA